MAEDLTTLATRKLVIAKARSCIGAHYLKGTYGHIPDVSSSLTMLPNEIVDETQSGLFTAKLTTKTKERFCSGKHGHRDTKKLSEGDINNSSHLASPDSYKWRRLIKYTQMNDIFGESCKNKMHFDCIGFVKWALKQIIPNYIQKVNSKEENEPLIYGIKGLKKHLEIISNTDVKTDDICAADILIRKKNGHIGFAVGDGQRVIQAEWEATGVVETDLGNWEFHGRIAKEYWNHVEPLPDEVE